MLSISPAVKIFLYAEPADLRRGYDGLASLVTDALGEDPLVVSRKRLRIDPYAYLCDVLTDLPTTTGHDHLAELSPDRFTASHPKHRLEHREREASQAKARRKDRRARRRQLARVQSNSKLK